VEGNSLPASDHINSTLASKCSALIRESAPKWKIDCQLVQRGSGFIKHAELKAVRANNEDLFHEAESTFLTGLVEQGQNDMTVSVDASGGGEKVTTPPTSFIHAN